MEIKDLQKKLENKEITCIYKVIKTDTGKKEVVKYNVFETTEVFDEDTENGGKKDCFQVAFEKPKKHWTPSFAKPFIQIESCENDRLNVTKATRGGWDVPNRFFWDDGIFFLTKEKAKEFAEVANIDDIPESLYKRKVKKHIK